MDDLENDLDELEDELDLDTLEDDPSSLMLHERQHKIYPALSRWAHSYNGYERFASSHWEDLLEPLTRKVSEDREVPEWAGVDLLRAWAFFIARTHHNSHKNDGSYSCCDAMYLIADAIQNHKAARRKDLPPRIPSVVVQAAKHRDDRR